MSESEKTYLPNGAELLAKLETHDGSGLVLARFHGPAPYVTWRYFRGDLKSTTWGHYFETLEEAEKSFSRRIVDVFDDAFPGGEAL